ncbi:hypothetical protein ACW2Q0_25680 [Nocardia sp. R16R-3T]
MLDALALIGRHASGALRYYPIEETIPEHRGVSPNWRELVYQTDKHHQTRVVRMVYEVCTFQALRDQLRCKEIWVVGADKWRNPAEDLPADFEEGRVEHYEALRKPLDGSEFIAAMQAEMRAELDVLHTALPKCDWLEIKDRKSGAIKLTPVPKQPEPTNLRKMKRAIRTRWGQMPLIDIVRRRYCGPGACARSPRSRTGASCPKTFLPSASYLGLCLRHEHWHPVGRRRRPRPQ